MLMIRIFEGVVIAAGVFVLLWRFHLLTFIYDAKASENGIRFTLFSALTIWVIRFENIQGVEEVRGGYFRLFVYNYKNRFFARAFLVKLKRGMFARKILLTPEDPQAFMDALRAANVPVSELSAGSWPPLLGRYRSKSPRPHVMPSPRN